MATELERTRFGAIAAAVARMGYRLAQRVIVLDVTRLLCLDRSSARLPETLHYGSTFRFLTAADIRHFAADRENDLDLSFAARIQGGLDLCYAVIVDERLASYIWLALGSIEAAQNRGSHPRSGVAVTFPEDMAFVYKAYTRPEYRGQRLYPICMGQSLEELSSRGIKRLLATTDWTNKAALRSCQRIGFRDLGPLWRFGVGRMMFTRGPAAARQLGIDFDQQAIIRR